MLSTWPCAVSAIVFFFFFQAEDGIRDTSVTGVQTCALPICGPRSGRRLLVIRHVLIDDADQVRRAFVIERQLEAALGVGRSEERRVGKEGRWRWGACH